MSEWLAARIGGLIDTIIRASGFGSVTVVVERGRIARIVWSVDEKVQSSN